MSPLSTIWKPTASVEYMSLFTIHFYFDSSFCEVSLKCAKNTKLYSKTYLQYLSEQSQVKTFQNMLWYRPPHSRCSCDSSSSSPISLTLEQSLASPVCRLSCGQSTYQKIQYIYTSDNFLFGCFII
jgi:hypothetical protein